MPLADVIALDFAALAGGNGQILRLNASGDTWNDTTFNGMVADLPQGNPSMREARADVDVRITCASASLPRAFLSRAKGAIITDVTDGSIQYRVLYLQRGRMHPLANIYCTVKY